MNGLSLDIRRGVNTDEAPNLKEDNASPKTAVAEIILENQRLNKGLSL